MPYRTALRSLVLKFEFQQQSPAVQIMEALLGTLTADYPELKRTPSSLSVARTRDESPGSSVARHDSNSLPLNSNSGWNGTSTLAPCPVFGVHYTIFSPVKAKTYNRLKLHCIYKFK